MVMVMAVIKPFKLDDVQQALIDLGIQGMTVSEVKGFGRQKGHVDHYRGAEYRVDFVPKLMVTTVVPEERVSAVMSAIQKSAYTGKIGDGKIFAYEIKEAMRIRTGETGAQAL